MLDNRIYGLDVLRAFSMLLGTLIHAPVILHMKNAGAIFGVSPSDIPDAGLMISLTIGWIHYWRMPAFFLLAGFFGTTLMAKRGPLGFAINRATKILITFFIFLMAYNAVFKALSLELFHLWFLYYLGLMYFLHIAYEFFYKGLQARKCLDSEKPRLNISILWLLCFVFVTSLFSINDFYTRKFPEIFGQFELLPFAHYFSWYFLGVWLFYNINFLDILRKKNVIKILAILTFIILVAQCLILIFGDRAVIAWRISYIIGFSIMALASTFLSLSIVLYFSFIKSKLVEYFVSVSYSYYLLHLFPALALGALFLSWGMSILSMVIMNILLIPIITLLMNCIFVKYTPLSWLINGYDKSLWKPFKTKH